MNAQIVLFVIPEEDLRSIMTEALQEYECPYSSEMVATVQEAQDCLSRGNVQAVVMTKSAALCGEHGTQGLVASQTGLPPTVTLIMDGDFPDYLYIPGAFNDWCTVPFSLEELFSRLTHLLERADKRRGTK